MGADIPVVIVTGASRGIGRAVVAYLLSLASPPYVLAISRSASSLSTLSNLTAPHISTHLETLPIDFSASSVSSEISEAVKLCLSKWNRVDAILLNHGQLDPVSRLEDANMQQWEECFRTNFFSNVEFVKSAIVPLRESKGRVVMVSSGAATSGTACWGAYGSSKAALNHLNVTLANEESDITTVAIRPGVVDTDMQSSLRERHGTVMKSNEHERFLKLKASGQLVKPEEVAVVLGNLCLRASKDLSGKFITWNEETLAAYRA